MSKLYECKISRLIICLCLIICIVSASFCISVDKADALVLNPWTIALCGSLLVAAGLSFNTAQQMESAVSSFAGSCDASLWDSLVSEAESFKDEYGTGFHFPITEAIVSAISGWLSGVTSAEGGSVSVPANISLSDSSVFSNVPVVSKESFSSCNTHGDTSVLNIADGQSVQVLWQANFSDGSTSKIVNFSRVGDNFFRDDKYLHAIQIVQSGDLLYLNFYTSNSASQHAAWALSNGNMGIHSTLSVVGVSTIPFDDVWAPGSTDSEKELTAGCDVVVPGGIINTDGVLESDVVAGMSASNVRANSGTNTDADVVAGTGTITGSGSGTGIFEGVGAFDLVFGIPILGDILKAILTGFDLLAGLISSVFSSPIEWLKELLTSIWNAITSGFEAVLNWGSSLFDSISQFFKDCLQFLKDILASLADFLTGIVAFIPDILAWLASYTLFSDLLNKFLPQPVAVVFISFFLASIAIWLFRMIANR